VISEAANNWLSTGERGISSEAIFSHLTGVNVVGGWGKCPPSDPSDLVRCRKLLDAVPEFRARLNEMAAVSDTWAALVNEWDSLCDLMDAEAPEWRDGRGSCPRTYERMKALGC
jgi:hypothetical protein